MSAPAPEAVAGRHGVDPGDGAVVRRPLPRLQVGHRARPGGAAVAGLLRRWATSSGPRSATLLALPLDRQIPFVVWTVWLYLPFYAGIFAMAITGLRRRSLFHRAVKGFLITMLIGALGHLADRRRIPAARRCRCRPRALSEAFLAWVQAVDPPGNVFPSLHVAHTSALAVILRRDRPRLGALAMVMALLLALSTLTTKQHFVVDVLSGWLIAFLREPLGAAPLRSGSRTSPADRRDDASRREVELAVPADLASGAGAAVAGPGDLAPGRCPVRGGDLLPGLRDHRLEGGQRPAASPSTTCRRWPWGPFAGAFVDRHDRRRVMLAAELVRGLAVGAIPLLYALGRLTPGRPGGGDVRAGHRHRHVQSGAQGPGARAGAGPPT